MRALWLLFLSTLLFAQSHPPSPAPSKPTKNNQREASGKQDKTAENQRISDSLSAAVNQLASEMAARETQANALREKGDSSTDRGIMWSAIVTAVATVFIGWLGYRQWRTLQEHREVFARQAGYIRRALKQTKIAAEAAKRTADAAAVQFELTERPWLSIEATPAGDLYFDPSGINLAMAYKVLNIGKSPATRISVLSLIHLNGPKRINVIEERDNFCEEVIRIKPGDRSAAILPGADTSVVLMLNRDQNYVNVSPMTADNLLSGYVITCVCYRPHFKPDSIYYTASIHQIANKRANAVLFKIGDRIPMADLALLAAPISGTVAV
jgi:hypothetical protein